MRAVALGHAAGLPQARGNFLSGFRNSKSCRQLKKAFPKVRPLLQSRGCGVRNGGNKHRWRVVTRQSIGGGTHASGPLPGCAGACESCEIGEAGQGDRRGFFSSWEISPEARRTSCRARGACAAPPAGQRKQMAASSVALRVRLQNTIGSRPCLGGSLCGAQTIARRFHTSAQWRTC